MPLSSLLSFAHLVGLALGVGSATVKLSLVLRCSADPGFLPTYMQVARPITRTIILGMILLTLSGLGWVLLGYPLTPRLIVKIAMVAALWVMGPVIDNVVEPRFRTLAGATGEARTLAFIRIQRQYLALEITATFLFYIIMIVWILG